MVRRTLAAFVLFAIAALSAMVIAPTSSAENAPVDRERTAAVVAAPVSVGDIPDVEGAVADSVAAFYADQQRQIDEYLAAVEAERLAELARAAAARPTSGGYHPGATVGECTGFAIPDYIIQRESGGNPSAYNPSGAYGCAQTLLSHYSGGGTCAGLDPYTIEGQRECVWRLSNGGTNLNPWAATR